MKEKLLSNTQTSFDDIKESYARICENIEKAKTAAGRTDDVRLMAVTKTVDPERINYAVGLGIDHRQGFNDPFRGQRSSR